MTLLLAAFDPPYWLSTVIKVLVVSIVVPSSAPRTQAPEAPSSCSPTV